MARKSRRGHYVDGEWFAAADDAGREAGHESLDSEAPSRTQLKNASHELQKVGERLLTMRVDVIAGLSLPEKLQDAILEAKRITNFGAKRRHMQFIGKLMRQLDPEALERVQAALRVEQRQGSKRHPQ